jgi:hypothetical protein
MMLNNFLYIYIEKYFLSSQHGFIPTRGTLSAWMDLLNKINKYDYIYEFDLKQFFPSVNNLEIRKILRSLNVPTDFANYLTEMNKSQPELPKKTLLDESKTFRINTFIARDRAPKLPIVARSYRYPKDVIPDQFKGVPQGSNLGPTLSILVLKSFLQQQVSVSYADDGLFFSNEPFEI